MGLLDKKASISNIPRNRIGGALADVLQAIKSNTGVVGDFMLGQAPEVLDNMSYGFNPTRGTGMTYGMKPEAADLANILPAATIGGLLGKSYSKLAGKEIARQVQGKTGLLGRNAIDPRMNITPFEQNHLAAQLDAFKNHGLPKNNTAMDRAKAMGFETDAYHGSQADIQAFDLSRHGQRYKRLDKPEPAIYAGVGDIGREVADAYGTNGAVYPLMIKNHKLIGADAEAGVPNYEALINDTANIRSKFGAFNMSNASSSDLLGYTTPAMAATLAGLSGAGLLGINYLNNK